MPAAAVVFDLFGTLLDIASLRTAAAFVCPTPDAFVATWREKQLAYAFASAIMDRYEDFDALTGHAARFAAAKHQLSLDASQIDALVRAWEYMQPYPDVAATLAALTAAGLRCAVLTNGTPATSRAAMRNAGIEASIEASLYVDSAGVYKPDRRVYDLVTRHYGVAPADLVFVTSNGWDATGAAAYGMRVAWCNRAGNPAETYGPPPAWTLTALDDLPKLLAAN
jgi:2-haloacid dehalogenase